MNIQQLKELIAGNANIIKAYYPPEAGMTDGGDYFFVKLYEKVNGYADDRSFAVIVKDRGKESEEVFWKGQVPQSLRTVSTAFKAKVEAFVAQYQTAHPELKWWEFNSVDEAKKVARLTAYVLVAPDLVAKQYIAWENGSGALQFYPVKA